MQAEEHKRTSCASSFSLSLSLSLFSVKEQESGRHLLQDFEVEPFYQPSLEREEKDKCRKKKERRDSKPER